MSLYCAQRTSSEIKVDATVSGCLPAVLKGMHELHKTLNMARTLQICLAFGCEKASYISGYWSCREITLTYMLLKYQRFWYFNDIFINWTEGTAISILQKLVSFPIHLLLPCPWCICSSITSNKVSHGTDAAVGRAGKWHSDVRKYLCLHCTLLYTDLAVRSSLRTPSPCTDFGEMRSHV